MKHQVSFQKIITSALRLIAVLCLPIFSFSQANNLCSGAVNLLSGSTCTPTAGSLVAVTTTYTAAGLTGVCQPTRPDVWYTFTAKTANPTITVAGTVADVYLELYTGTCAALTNVQCSATNTLTGVALAPGTVYYVRVYSNSNALGLFTICVVDPAPVNDNCIGAINLVSNLFCTNTVGNLYAATTSATPLCAAGTVAYDIWYKFIASSTEHTITLSGLGASISAGARMQLFSGTCGALTSISCGTTSLNPTTLTPSVTYYIRIYVQAPSAALTTNVGAGFNICLTNPPSNDECSGAINLAVNGGCNNIWGSVLGSTPSGVTPNCSGGNGYDVWFKFTAISTAITVLYDNFGANFANRRFQVLQGNCAGFTSFDCSNSTNASVTRNLTGLTIGAIYYIKIGSTDAAPPTTNGGFSICLSSTTANPRYGNSYVNITKQTTGGVVEPNDILEIRMSIAYNGTTTLFRPRYLDNVPTNTTMLTGATDYVKVITNEGVPWQQFTRAGSDDQAMYNATPGAGEFNIKANLAFGNGNTPITAGNVVNTNGTDITGATGTMGGFDFKPEGGGSLLFSMAFRVQVTGTVGQTITLGPGRFVYKLSNGGTDIILQNNAPYTILISAPQSL